MIKNNAQLVNAQDRLNAVRAKIDAYRSRYSGSEFSFFVAPLQVEIEELRNEIDEYLELRDLPFEDAILSTLSEPTVIEGVGELLAKIRIAAKLSQAEMSERLGWQQANISRFESENYSSQTISKIVEYANALGVWLHVTPSLSDKPNLFRIARLSQMKKARDEILFRLASTNVSEVHVARLSDLSTTSSELVRAAESATTT